MDAIVTLVSLDHPWLPVYTGLPPLSEYPWMPELLWYPRTIQCYQYILVYPLVRVSVDYIVTLVSLDHQWLPVYTGLPPCQSICGCHSYSGIPGPSMVTSVYWSTPLVRVSVDAIVTLVSLDHPWLPVYTGLPPLLEYLWMPELLWYPWTIHGYQYILVYPPCQSIRGCHSYSGIPGPSSVTSIYWSTPLSEYPWMP